MRGYNCCFLRKLKPSKIIYKFLELITCVEKGILFRSQIIG
jgi:hypothetical protein